MGNKKHKQGPKARADHSTNEDLDFDEEEYELDDESSLLDEEEEAEDDYTDPLSIDDAGDLSDEKHYRFTSDEWDDPAGARPANRGRSREKDLKWGNSRGTRHRHLPFDPETLGYEDL
jgi:hypothetical protein